MVPKIFTFVREIISPLSFAIARQVKATAVDKIIAA
jgi:hypothetical protein